jgi:hypothetical protein
MAATVGFVPVLTTMNAGQVNLFVLLATVAALAWLRSGRDLLAGLVLAIGIWLKPFPVALIALMLWHRRWRVALGVVAGSVLVMLLGLVIFGPGPTLSQFRGTARTASGLTALTTDPVVQNLNGLLGRSLAGVPAQLGVTIFLLAAGAVAWLSVAAIVTNRAGDRIELEAALLIAATHLVAPLTWYHHLTMLVLVLGVVVVHWRSRPRSDIVLGLLLAGFLLTDLHGLAWRQLAGLHPALTNFPALTTLLLWALVLTELRARRGPPHL